MALPNGYKRLKYIEATGTQYIDTGFKPNQDTRVVAKVRCPVGTSANYIFGARYALSQQNYSFFASKNGHYAFIYNTTQVDFDKSANTDEPFVIDFNKNVATIGNKSVSGTYATFAAPVNLILFGVNSPDKIIYGSSRIYSCKIYDNGTLVRDFVPCENTAGQIGMWDDVNSVFYGNNGTGTFSGQVEGESVPIGYQQLEHIQSSGTQYIDTGYYPKWNTRVVMDVQMSTYSASRSPFGCRNSNSATASTAFLVMQTGTNTLRSDYFGSSKTLTITASTDQRLTIDQNKNVLTVNGQSVTNTAVSSGTSAYTLLLFTYSNSGSAGSKTSMTLYSCKIYENDVLVRDFVPYKNASGTVGLWDTVNCVFYTNAGTDSFVGKELPKAHKTLINGTGCEIVSGRCLIDGTGYTIKKGRTLVAGTGYDIKFGVPLATFAEGEIVLIPENGVDVEFYIAKHNYETGLNGNGRTLLVRKDCYDKRIYDDRATENSRVIYKNSKISSFLNGTYLSLLPSGFRDAISTTKFYVYDGGNADATVSKAVFLLAVKEVYDTNYNALDFNVTLLPTASILLKAYYNGSEVDWWTRTMTQYDYAGHNAINKAGTSHFSASTTNKYGCRPCFTLPEETCVNPSNKKVIA